MGRPPSRCPGCHVSPVEKVCPRCEVGQPPEEFYALAATRDGLSIWCKTCMRERNRQHHHEMGETRREKMRAYKRSGPDIPSRSRETKLRYSREHRARNPERARELWSEQEARRRARKQGNGIEPYARAEIIARDRSRCHFCGKKCAPADIHIDHLVPIIQGGPDAPHNVAVSCADCNLASGPGRLPAQLRMVG